MFTSNHDRVNLEEMDKWYADHFKELVRKYGGKAIAVMDGDVVAVADTEKEADEMARRLKPEAIPLVLSVPTEEELLCLLQSIVTRD